MPPGRRLHEYAGFLMGSDKNVNARPETRIAALSAQVEQLKLAEQRLLAGRQELSVLHELAHRVGRRLVLAEMVESSLAAIESLLEPDLVLLFLRRDDDLVLQDRRGRVANADGFHVHKVGECLCGLAVREARPMYSADIHSDPRCTWTECREAGFASFAALPLTGRDGVIGVLGLASRTPRDFSERAAFLEALAGEVAIGLQNAVLYRQLQEQKQELERQCCERRRLEEEIAGIADRMQSNLGRELHDGLMQRLAGVVYLNDVLESRTADGDAISVSDIQEVSVLLRALLDQVESLARGLYPVELEEHGLLRALDTLACTMRRLYGVDVTFDSGSCFEFADSFAMLHVYRIAQEAASNAIRHGKARRIDIHLTCDESHCTLTVADDGCGFDPAGVTRGMGLTSIEYRARALGGAIDIAARPGKGAQLTCRFPRTPTEPREGGDS